MMNLSQINSQLVGKKTGNREQFGTLYHLIQQPELFVGEVKRYQPYQVDADGRPKKEDQLPDEVRRLQANYQDVLFEVQRQVGVLIDLTATQDKANTTAKADIVIDGKVVLKDVPVTTLMYLKSQAIDLHTFFARLPTPDPGLDWAPDPNQGCLRSVNDAQVVRTKKMNKVVVLHAPTDKHPAQTQMVTEDTPIGAYLTTKFSGGCPAVIKTKLVEGAQKLIDAIKAAHELANSKTEAPMQSAAAPLFEYLLAPLREQKSA
jgi:hypothetical protein